MLQRDAFLEQLRRHAAYVEGKAPITGEMLAALGAELERGEPAWFSKLAAAWKGRRFGPYYEAPALLLAGLHREALAARALGLARVFPTCGGSGAGAGRAAVEFLEAAGPEFFDALGPARLQANDPARAIAWLLPACMGFLTRSTPFHLVELGASAGLVLVGDYLPRTTPLLLSDGSSAAEPERYRDSPYPVLSRSGLDTRPRRLEEREDRLWLEACLWPHDLDRLSRLRTAADLFVSLARERSGPRLFEETFARAADWVRRRVPPHPEEGLLVFNAQAADFLSDAEHADLARGLAEALEPWGDRAFWVEFEYPRGAGRDAPHELRVHRWLEGRFESKVLARVDEKAKSLRLEPGWDFLRPLAPLAPPRNTREEPPKQLEPGLFRFGGNA